jgi:hypothetical protein
MQAVLLKLSFIYALCQMIKLSEDEKPTMKKVEVAAWDALIASHGTISFNKLKHLTIRLNEFCKLMKWEQGNLQAALNFSISVVEEMLCYIKDSNRRSLLQGLMTSLNNAYQYFTDKEGERYDMIEEGLKANELWKRMFE